MLLNINMDCRAVKSKEMGKWRDWSRLEARWWISYVEILVMDNSRYQSYSGKSNRIMMSTYWLVVLPEDNFRSYWEEWSLESEIYNEQPLISRGAGYTVCICQKVEWSISDCCGLSSKKTWMSKRCRKEKAGNSELISQAWNFSNYVYISLQLRGKTYT